ncbi:uncharacterized protein LOC127722409 [Mytilus californianus]|uniref:uncharacterized protein LOC127722409 n=1 Tax=Mytilus californianus TaxID=6549 RepID=UPI0022472093|nr:uncharacterized protein LOC127722409 [Mytilus californianus]
MHVTIGNITVPRGSGRLPITRLKGASNSMALKRSILQVCNEDKMCLATAIGRCFLKLCKIVPLEKWRETTKNDEDMNTCQKVIKHGMTTKSYFKNVSASALKNTSYSKTMAITLCKEANLSTDEALSIRDIENFENVLDVNILVLSARLGNKFCRVSTKAQRKNIYLYLIENADGTGHFQGIGSINGFFGYGYFCESCLKPYKNKGKHSCVDTCAVCGSLSCRVSNHPVICSQCNQTCRSQDCYDRHNTKTSRRDNENSKTMCERFYQCKNCRKIRCRQKRSPEQHTCGEWRCKNCFEYHIGTHWCYQRKTLKDTTKKEPRKYFFYDFETTQNEKMSCEEGWLLLENQSDFNSACSKMA